MAIPAHPLDGLLAAFDSGSANFALATPDGRVRTYDTVTGRLRSTLANSAAAAKASGMPNGHLVEGNSCLAWVDSAEGSAAAAVRSGSSAGPSHSWLAVGTAAGGVKLYDTATGELRWQAANCNEGGVGCLAFSPARRSTLVSSGKDGQAVLLDASAGKQHAAIRGSKHAVTAAAISDDGSRLFLGGSTLSLWDLDTQQRVSKFTGHPLPVRAVAFAPGGHFALSCAEGERLAAVWATPSRQGGKKKKGGVAAASLAVEQPVVALRTLAADGHAAGSFYVAAVTEAGDVYVWRLSPTADGGVSQTQLARVSVGPHSGSGGAGEVALAASLEPAQQGVTLLVVAGSPAKPRFERMHINGSSSSKTTFLQPLSADALIRPGGAGAAQQKQQQQQQGRGVDVLGPENAGEPVQQRQAGGSRKRQEPEPDGPAAAGAAAAGAGAAAAAAADDADGMSQDDEAGLDGSDSGAAEPTLGERLAELEARVSAAAAAGADAAGAGGDAEAAVAPVPEGPLKADSLGVLLSQALRSGDRALLERCLSVGSERIISNSVKRLLPMDAAALLRAAVERLQSRPARGQQLAAWVHAVLLHHTAYLMSSPGAAGVMSGLYQLIEARLAMQRQLLSLAGRLELLLAQGGGSGGDGGGEGGGAAAGPQVVYEESDSEAEVEVVDAAGAGYGSDDDDEYETDDGSDDEDMDDEDDEEQDDE